MPGSNPSSLGEMLLTYRIRTGLSQEALAEASGVSARTISDLERGQRTAAHLETIRMLAAALELSESQRRHLLGAGRPNLFQPTVWTDSPPQATYGTARWAASIPTPTTPLVGRANELAQLMAALDARAGEIVTLTGPGGVGKTRLAVEAAHRLAPERAGGAVFVNLATETGAERVPGAIADALGLSLQAEFIGDEVKRFLSHRDALLILDNFEHVIDAAPFVAELAGSCPQLTVLVTSRVRLRLSVERELTLAPLPLGNLDDALDALQANDANLLFATRAQRIDPDFTLSEQNAVSVTEICRRVDGLPLGIELAASRLRMLPVSTLLDRLDRRLPLLTGGDRDLHPRQQSMRATIAWSYGLLSADEQRYLCWSAVFVGGLSLESAEALGAELGLSPLESLEALTTLVESGLAHQNRTRNGSARVRLFETIREFGFEQLDERGERESALSFHAMHFLEFASCDAPGPDELAPDIWISRIAPERANLIPAFDYLCTAQTADACLRFAAAMAPYWEYSGPIAEAQPRLGRALALARPEPTVVELQIRCWLSLMLAVSSDYEGALASIQHSIALANQIGSPGHQAVALQALALTWEYHEQFEQARELLEEVIRRWESIGNRLMHASCLMYHSGLEYARGNLERAMQEVEQARLVFAEAGEVAWVAGCSWYQGMFAMEAGSVAEAVTLHEFSLRAWLQCEMPWRWFKPLIGLADAGAAVACWPEAARLLGAADELIAVTGAEIMPFDLPGYTRAEVGCEEALGNAEFQAQRLAGHRLTADDWLSDATTIVAAARELASPTTE